MEFLDKKTQRRRTLQLYLGYGLVAIAIAATATILLYQAYGFGLDKDGQVIQNGLLYVSSQPGGADVYLNTVKKDQTNTRFNLPAGQYNVSLKRTGYRDWNRQVTVDGGAVARFDYPFLFPSSLTTTAKTSFDAAPVLTTESPNRRWLLVAQPGAAELGFTQYDLQNPDEAATTFTLPSSVATIRGGDAWQATEWSNDNRHLLMKHTFSDGFEYILLDRQTPADSRNLSTTLTTVVADIRLLDKRPDTFVLYDITSQVVSKASLKNPTPVTFAEHVVSFQTYSDDRLLYVTETNVAAGKAKVMLLQNGKSYTIRTLNSGSNYLLDMTSYDGDFIIAAGAGSEDKVYLYKDPAQALSSVPKQVLVPVGVLKVPAVNYLSFSSSTQFVLAETGNRFAVYDIKNDKTYNYDVKAGLDAPQTSARWMDGNRLTYVSAGALQVIDFDNNNPQSLMVANPGSLPYFDATYQYVYTFATVGGKFVLQTTALRTAADL